MSIETRIKQVRSENKNIMKEIASLLDKKKIDYKMVNPAEIKAQASRKEIGNIVCQLPISKGDISIVIDIVETKKATYIRKK